MNELPFTPLDLLYKFNVCWKPPGPTVEQYISTKIYTEEHCLISYCSHIYTTFFFNLSLRGKHILPFKVALICIEK